MQRIAIIFLLTLPAVAHSQGNIDHWETVIYNDDVWRYRLGTSEPPAGWNDRVFDDSLWLEGQGGFGYGDGDDNTILSPVISVFLRKEFTIIDTSEIEEVILNADFDDAFVAYLNGVEIARSNIGQVGINPAYNDVASGGHEAQMYQNGLPDAFIIKGPQLNGLLINGTNTLAIQVHNWSISSSDMSAIFFLSLGINDTSTYYGAVPGWFYEPFTSSNLPVLVINTNGQGIPDEPRIVAHLGIIDNGKGNRNQLTDTYNGYNGNISIEIRGSSSQMFPKKNFGFETQDAAGNNNNVSLLGMPIENDWILYGPYSDKSLLRNYLSYHIGWQTGRYTPRVRWCELLIDDQYQGLYLLTEKIKQDSNRLDIAHLKPEDISGDQLTGGYIFEIDRDDPGENDGWYSAYRSGVFYVYKDPGYDKLAPEQKAYLSNYINGFESVMNDPATSHLYEQYVDVPSFVDYWIATEITKQIDAYRLSFYMYKMKDSNGGKIHFGPLWDLNLGYGNYNYGADPGPEDWSYLWANNSNIYPLWLLKLMSVPDIRNQINCRWHELRQELLNTDSLLLYLDNAANDIEEARIRNFQRWQILGQYIWPNYFVGANYGEELSYLENWLTSRLQWMDDNMIGTCVTSRFDKPGSLNHLLEVSPNPFQDQVNFLFIDEQNRGGELRIYDLIGKMVARVTIMAGKPIHLSLANQSKGLYIYNLVLDDQTVLKGKLIKSR